MDKIEDAEQKLILDSMRNDLLSYAMGIYPKFVPNEFAEAIAFEIQEVFEGRNDRLMIFAPPRHGKSLLTSEIGPAFFLGKYPDKKIIAASHTERLAEDMGMLVRNNMLNPIHEAVFGPKAAVDRSKAAAGNFRTVGKGQYFAVGVGGTPIGKGADVYIIDDPIRNRKDVESEQQREDLKAWYSSAVLSRLEGQGGIILMHQRWHEDDLAGWLLKEYAEDGWRVVSFPAVINDEEDKEMDYLGRDYGEALIPELHSSDKLDRLRRNMLKKDWMSMYQQRPTSAGGDKFTEGMLLRYESHPSQVRAGANVYLIVDPASGNSSDNDYTAMAVIGVASDGNFYILDLVRERLDLNGRTNKMFELHRRWRPIVTAYEEYGAHSDISHIQYVQERENYRFPITKLGGNRMKKKDRIERLIPDMTNGRWYAPQYMARMNEDGEEYEPIEVMIKEEMLPFDSGKNDDAIDAISRIYDLPVIYPSGTSSTSRTPHGPKVSPW